ncbi:Gfo/Idh/MocA family oxidoreductase [Streptomyces cheonanensis]|uniref:Gfo/Idh/MocA family oxidoreductase n=2 Tax=Streptomyces TaxID=1883 RepID=A0ABN2USC1_9ACTN|nr:Gfo/Idh/MocA family oxidoreductase [Streptomyces sp. AA0539]
MSLPLRMRFGLFGTGPWAQLTQGPALARHPGVDLVGVWGRRPDAARELAGHLGTRAYEDADALIADCDAVAIALPPDVQAPLAVRAARAGRHLLLDKPLATTVPAAREVAEAAQASGVASVVFFTLHFTPETAAWLAEQGTKDGWVNGRAEWFAGIFAPGSDSRYASSPWRRERGGLWDIGPHALSVLLPPLGDVTGLDAVGAARGPGDMVHLTLRHVSGASSTVTVSLGVPPQASSMTAVLRGTPGIVTLPDRDDPGHVAAFAAAVDALERAARTGDPHPCDVRFALRVTEILAAAEERLGD